MKLTPGDTTHHPLLGEVEVLKVDGDRVACLQKKTDALKWVASWNLKEEIGTEHRLFSEDGGVLDRVRILSYAHHEDDEAVFVAEVLENGRLGMMHGFLCSKVRFAPIERMISLNGVEIPAPETKEPSDISLPEVGTKWRHKNGRTYKVAALANHDPDRSEHYVPTIVYEDVETGRVGCYHASEWSASFSPYKRSITIQVSIPAPETEAPTVGTSYWFISPGSERGVTKTTWCNGPTDYRYLERGLIHLNEENALQAVRALFPNLEKDLRTAPSEPEIIVSDEKLSPFEGLRLSPNDGRDEL